MSELKIISGRTRRVEANVSVLFDESVEDSIIGYKEERLSKWGVNAGKTWQVIAGKGTVPVYAYLVRYLLEIFEIDGLGVDAAIKLLGESESYESAPSQIKSIIDMTFDRFRENGCGGAEGEKIRGGVLRQIPSRVKKGRMEDVFWDRNALLSKLKAETISVDEMLAIAFGLSMDYYDVVMFLKKVMRRADFDLFNKNEFLLYLTFRYAGGKNIRSFFDALRNTYEEISPEKGNIAEAIIENDRTNTPEGMPKEGYYFVLGSDGSVPEAIRALLADHKAYIEAHPDYVGQSAKTAAELLETLKEQCREMLESSKGDNIMEFAKGNVTVYYNPSQGLDIPEGTVFYRAKDKTDRPRAQFTVDNAVKIEPTDKTEYSEITLEIECLKSGKRTEKLEDNTGYVPKNSVFEGEAFLTGIHNKSGFKPKKDVKVGEIVTISGKVTAMCRVGVTVKSGTVLKYINDGKVTEFAVKSDCDNRAKAVVPVTAAEAGEEATKNTLVDCSIEGWRDKFCFENSKISRVEKGVAGSRGALYPYLYSSAGDPAYIKGANAAKYFTKLGNVLKGTRIENDKMTNIKMFKEPSITRSDILTLTFLVYVTEDAGLFNDIADLIEAASVTELSRYEKRGKSAAAIEAENERLRLVAAEANEQAHDTYRMLLGEFRKRANENLNKCGFYPFYLANPYDGLLALLLASESPINAFRELWGTYELWRIAQKG